MEKTMVLMIGIQGSGKSTFYHKYLADGYVRVNLDTLKTRNREEQLVSECFREGKSFAVDNTNPTRADRQRYIPLAQYWGYRHALSGTISVAGAQKYRRQRLRRPPINCSCRVLMKALMNCTL